MLSSRDGSDEEAETSWRQSAYRRGIDIPSRLVCSRALSFHWTRYSLVTCHRSIRRSCPMHGTESILEHVSRESSQVLHSEDEVFTHKSEDLNSSPPSSKARGLTIPLLHL